MSIYTNTDNFFLPGPIMPWVGCFAWRPVILTRTGKRVWLKRIYKRFNINHNSIEYGDLFDVLMCSQANACQVPARTISFDRINKRMKIFDGVNWKSVR